MWLCLIWCSVQFQNILIVQTVERVNQTVTGLKVFEYFATQIALESERFANSATLLVCVCLCKRRVPYYRVKRQIKVRVTALVMSFVKNIFGLGDSKETEDEEDVSEETSTSDDTGFFSPDISNNNSASDLEARLDATSAPLEPDCSTISNFFGYWWVYFL